MSNNTPQNIQEGFSLKNRRAEFEYQLIDVYEAGIMLTGTEVKSLRAGKVSMADAYCVFVGTELYVRNLHIAEYKFGTHYNHDPKAPRKLLLQKKELKKLLTKVKEKGLTIIPVKIFFSETGFAKLQISLAKGKKYYDKRASLKEKEGKRQIARGQED